MPASVLDLAVAADIGYGLPRKGRPEIVSEWIERLHLTGLEARYPHRIGVMVDGRMHRFGLTAAVFGVIAAWTTGAASEAADRGTGGNYLSLLWLEPNIRRQASGGPRYS